MADKIGVVLALDGEGEFTQGMRNASTSAKNLQSDLRTLKNDFKDNANSMEYLKQRQDILRSSQDAYAKTLEAAKKGLSHQKETYKKQQDELKKLQSELKSAESAQKKFEQSGDTTSSAYKKSKKAVEDYRKAVEKQGVEIQKSEGKLSNWEHEVNKAQHNVNSCGKAVEQNAKYLNEASKSADGCATSIDRYGKEVKETAKESEQAAGKAKKLGESLKNAIAFKVVDMAGNAISEIGEKAIEAAKYVIDVGSSFEAAMSKVEALSGATGADLEALSEKAQMLGRTTQFSASEAADALSNMALAGWDTNEMLNGIDGVLDLAAASGMDLASAADAVAGYLAAFNMKASESGKLADVMATAQAKSKTTATQLAEAYGTCATNMTQAGQEMTTTTALLEGLASVNDTGSAAGTKMSAVMAQITQKMKDGKIAIGDTQVAVTDSTGKFRDMIDIIADVEKATDGMTDAQRASALQATFNRQSTAGMNEMLAVGSEQLRTYKSELENSSGAAENMAGTMNDNLQGAVKEANSATEGLGIALYEKVNGPLTGAVRIATKMINGITDAISPQKTELEQFIADIEAENERIDALIKSAESDIDMAAAKTTELETYKSTILELQEVLNNGGELDAFQLQQMKTAVTNVSEEVPLIGENFDAVTGKIKLSTETINTLFAATENGLMQSAMQSAMQKEMQAVADARINEARALAAVNKAQKEYDDYVAANPGVGQMSAAGTVNATAEWFELQNALSDATAAQVEAAEKTKEAQDAYEETAEAARILEEQQKKEAEATSELARREMVEVQQAELRKKKEQEKAEAAQEATAATEDESEADEELAKAEAEAAKAAEEAAKKVEEAHDNAAKAIKDAYDSAKKAAEDAFKVNPFKEWEQNEEEGITKLQEALDSQLAGMENYAENLQIVTEHVGNEITPEFMQYLQDMGTGGAQVMQEMAEALESGDTGKVEAVMKTFADAMNQKEAISTAMAANAVALQTGTKQMGSSASEWDDLKGLINGKISSLGNETRTSLEQHFRVAATEANRLGVAIPEGLIEGIESSDDPAGAVQNAIDQINSAVTGQLEGLAEVAKESGATLPKGLEEGISNGTVDVTSAYTQLLEALSSVQATTESAGKDAGKALAEGQASGVEESAGEVTSAAESAASDAAEAAEDKADEFSDSGKQAGEEYASGISSAQGSAVSAAGNVASAAKSAAASYENSWYSIGVNSAQGMANGIQGQISSVANQAANLVRTAINAAKSAGGIQSPSKKFRDLVGKQLGRGMALGIRQSTKMSEDAAKYQMGKTLAAAQDFIKKNKKKILTTGTTLAEATDYTWEALAGYEIGKNFKIGKKKKVKSGKKTKKVKKGAEEYYGEVYEAAETYLSNVQALYDTTDQQELKYWQKLLKRLKKGTSAWYSAKRNIKKLSDQIREDEAEAAENVAEAEKKAAEEAAEAEEKKYDKILSRAEEYVSKQESLNKMSVSAEIAYWRKILKQLKKGSDQYKTVIRKITDLKKQFGTIGTAESLIGNYQTYYDMSEKAVMQYWKEIRKHYKAGTEERISADQKYLEAKKAYNDRLKQIEEDYAEKIKEASQKYKDAVEDRKKAIVNAYDLFEAFESSSATGGELLFNIKSQAAGYEEWTKSIESLEKRGIFSKELMDTLTEKGPQEIAAIKALLTLTDDELKEYQAAYDKKEKTATTQAKKENEDLKKTVSEEIANLKAQRKTEIDDVKTGIDTGLLSLAKNIKKIAEDMTSALVAAFTAQGSKSESSTGDAVKSSTVAAAGASDLVKSASGDTGKKPNTPKPATQAKPAAVQKKAEPAAAQKKTEPAKTESEEEKKKRLLSKTHEKEEELKLILQKKTLTPEERDYAKRIAEEELNAEGKAAKATSASKETTNKAKQNSDIKKIINAGKKRSKTLTSAEKKNQTELWKHIASKYGRTPTGTIFQKIAAVLGMKTTKKPTAAQKSSILKQLKARGLATGKRSILEDGIAWIDEHMDSRGPEMVVRKSDKAIMTRISAGDAVVPANLASNLFKWGAISPESLQLASGAEMNEKLMSMYSTWEATARGSNADILRALADIVSYLPEIAAGMHLSIDGRELADRTLDYTSRGLARRARRR